MTIRIDFYGYRYEDSTPSFVMISEALFHHRPSRRLLDIDGVQEQMSDASYVPDAKEVGKDDAWAKTYLNIDTTSLTSPGQPPVVVQQPTPTTGVTVGKPGSWTGGTPADLQALQALGDFGQAAAWTAGQSVPLGNGQQAHWDGTAWAAGVVPTPQAPAFTVAATGGTSATIDVSLGGNPSTGGTITITGLAADSQAIDGINPITVPANSTGHEIAVLIANELSSKTDTAADKDNQRSTSGQSGHNHGSRRRQYRRWLGSSVCIRWEDGLSLHS